MLERIRASIPALPPAEQRVAKLVLADPRAFASLPVVELAERSHVSKPTVVRFCRSVGYDGLTDFKRKLAGSVNEGVPFVHRSVDEDDKSADIIVKVIDNTVSALLKYRNDAAGHAFERAIVALADTGRHGGRIDFYGVGNSGIVALDAQHKFFRLGVRTTVGLLTCERSASSATGSVAKLRGSASSSLATRCSAGGSARIEARMRSSIAHCSSSQLQSSRATIALDAGGPQVPAA